MAEPSPCRPVGREIEVRRTAIGSALLALPVKIVWRMRVLPMLDKQDQIESGGAAHAEVAPSAALNLSVTKKRHQRDCQARGVREVLTKVKISLTTEQGFDVMLVFLAALRNPTNPQQLPEVRAKRLCPAAGPAPRDAQPHFSRPPLAGDRSDSANGTVSHAETYLEYSMALVGLHWKLPSSPTHQQSPCHRCSSKYCSNAVNNFFRYRSADWRIVVNSVIPGF